MSSSRCPTARAVAPSYTGGDWPQAKSSRRSPRTSTKFIPQTRATSLRNARFLATGSRSVTDKSGKIIFKLKPGNPAPLPMSNSLPLQPHPTAQIETFPKMPGNATFPVTNARQVNLLVPSQEQFEISDQLADLIATKAQSERFEQLADSGLVQHLQPILKAFAGTAQGDAAQLFHMEHFYFNKSLVRRAGIEPARPVRDKGF